MQLEVDSEPLTTDPEMSKNERYMSNMASFKKYTSRLGEAMELSRIELGDSVEALCQKTGLTREEADDLRNGIARRQYILNVRIHSAMEIYCTYGLGAARGPEKRKQILELCTYEP
ncbi:hypothetical protein ISN75_06615 [Dyella marensis]|uniref:hypothetical protein n=1 Tax=Dyella marensis TaxID=500610 RepID=UPI0031D403FA